MKAANQTRQFDFQSRCRLAVIALTYHSIMVICIEMARWHLNNRVFISNEKSCSLFNEPLPKALLSYKWTRNGVKRGELLKVVLAARRSSSRYFHPELADARICQMRESGSFFGHERPPPTADPTVPPEGRRRRLGLHLTTIQRTSIPPSTTTTIIPQPWPSTTSAELPNPPSW